MTASREKIFAESTTHAQLATQTGEVLIHPSSLDGFLGGQSATAAGHQVFRYFSNAWDYLLPVVCTTTLIIYCFRLGVVEFSFS